LNAREQMLLICCWGPPHLHPIRAMESCYGCTLFNHGEPSLDFSIFTMDKCNIYMRAHIVIGCSRSGTTTLGLNSFSFSKNGDPVTMDKVNVSMAISRILTRIDRHWTWSTSSGSPTIYLPTFLVWGMELSLDGDEGCFLF